MTHINIDDEVQALHNALKVRHAKFLWIDCFLLTGQIMVVGFLRCVDIFHDINLLQGQYL